MARKFAPKFIPTASPSGAAMLALSDIPEEVKREAEEIYTALKANDGRIRIEFDTKGEVTEYALQLNSYCTQRPAELGGPIRFRRSPSRGLADNVMDFRITDLPTPEEKAKEAASKAAKDATVKVQAVANGNAKPAAPKPAGKSA